MTNPDPFYLSAQKCPAQRGRFARLAKTVAAIVVASCVTSPLGAQVLPPALSAGGINGTVGGGSAAGALGGAPFAPPPSPTYTPLALPPSPSAGVAPPPVSSGIARLPAVRVQGRVAPTGFISRSRAMPAKRARRVRRPR